MTAQRPLRDLVAACEQARQLMAGPRLRVLARLRLAPDSPDFLMDIADALVKDAAQRFGDDPKAETYRTLDAILYGMLIGREMRE